jgi:hypothetical protein
MSPPSSGLENKKKKDIDMKEEVSRKTSSEKKFHFEGLDGVLRQKMGIFTTTSGKP